MNKPFSRLTSLVVLAAMIGQVSVAASVGSKSAAYVGGTWDPFKGAGRAVAGTLDTGDPQALTFTANDGAGPRTMSIPYGSIHDVEYGQKAGRRFGAAVATSLVTGPFGLLVLLSKNARTT